MNSQTFRFLLGQFSCLSILDCTSSYPATRIHNRSRYLTFV
jgi:hypothetical protein